MKKRSIPIALAAIALLIQLGCGPAHLSKSERSILTTGNALEIAADTYERTMASIKELKDADRLSKDQVVKIRKISKAYWAAYHAAADGLAAYTRTLSAADYERTEKAINEASEFAGQLLEYALPLIEKGL